MNQHTSGKELEIFLQEFQLKREDGIARFDARVNIYKKGIMETLESEIQVITSDGLASIYFINPTYQNLNIPDMFDGKQTEFKFNPGKGLKIFPRKETEEIVISISPFVF